MLVKLSTACEGSRGQGTPAGSSYTLYVELLTLLLGTVNRCAEESSLGEEPLVDVRRRRNTLN